jgi:hypothetical protein
MNRAAIHVMIVLGGVCLLSGTSHACISPSVWIWDWLHYLPFGENVTLEAQDYSGTFIGSWYWYASPSSGVSEIGSSDQYGVGASSTRTYSFSTAGERTIWAEAWNGYAWGSDYARIYVVKVDSVSEYLSGASSIYVPAGGDAFLKAYPYPNVSWPSGHPTWSFSFIPIPSGSSQTNASLQWYSDGSAALTGIDLPGLYNVRAYCGSADGGASISVLAYTVNITTPSGGFATTSVNTPYALACEPSLDISGQYVWSVSPSSGASISPSSGSSTPTFTATEPGTYTVTVEYRKDYGGLVTAVASASATIEATIGVQITSPTSFPQSVAVGSPVSFTCQPTGGGTIAWKAKLLPSGSYTSTGFSNPSSTTTNFTPSQYGNYEVKVEYTEGGYTASDTGSVKAVSVDVSPSSTVSVARGVAYGLTSTPRNGTGSNYSWTKYSGPGTVTFSSPSAQNPTFTATVTGDYKVRVQCQVDGVQVSKISGTIKVVGVDITTPASSVTVEADQYLQLDCTPLNGTGTEYLWHHMSGPGTGNFSPNPNMKNPGFMPMVPGTHTVRVQCKVNGVLVSSDDRVITAVDVDITTPSFPVSVPVGGNLTLGCTPLPAGTTGSNYSWTPANLISPSSGSSSPTFSSSQAGTFNVGVQGTVSGVAVSDSKSPIHVVEIGELWGTCGTQQSQTQLYVAKNSVVTLHTIRYPTEADWPAGTPTWSLNGPSGSGTLTPSNGTHGPVAVLNDLTVQGTYTITAFCGSSQKAITVTVVDVAITAPSSFPAYVGVNSPLQLGCAPQGGTGTDYSWTKVSGPGIVTFSGGGTTPNPTFTASAIGDYTVQVQCQVNGVQVSKVSGTIKVVGVDITTPNFPANVSVNNPLQLDCTPSVTGGTYSWSIASGPPVGNFSSTTAKNPTFTTGTVGTYTLQVQYTIDGSTVTATTGSIGAFAVGIVVPSAFPAYVGTGSPLQLECVPMGSIGEGTYSWSKVSGPGDVTFSDASSRTPTFTATVSGNYVVQVVYANGGFNSIDISGTITAVDVIANQNYIALGGDATIIHLTSVTSILDFGELRLAVGPDYDYENIQLTDELGNVLTLTNGQLTWNLSDPGVQVPSGVHVSIVGGVLPVADQVFHVTWWPDGTHAAVNKTISLKPVRLMLRPSFNRLFIGIPNKITLDYEPATLTGTVTVTVTTNPDKVRFWAERAMETPVQTVQWNLSDPVDAAKAVYAEGVSTGEGSVYLQLDYSE